MLIQFIWNNIIIIFISNEEGTQPKHYIVTFVSSTFYTLVIGENRIEMFFAWSSS